MQLKSCREPFKASKSLLLAFLLLLSPCYSMSDSMFVEEITELGYPHETHTVKTADGFILTLFRIQKRGSGQEGLRKGLRPVLLAHGLDELAHIWIINESDTALGLVLADKGYDVWLLNSRGSAYSREHEHLSVMDNKYWDFSFQEMAQHDVPAVLDYIYRLNGQKQKILAVGHSQGSTQLLASITDNVTQEFVQSRLVGMIGVAPAAHFSDLPDKTKNIQTAVSIYTKVHDWVGTNYPLLSTHLKTFAKRQLKSLCHILPFFCESILSLSGMDMESSRRDLVPKLLQILPGGASFRCYLHFGQLGKLNSETPKLRRFDFGPEENLRRYGSEEPPEYDYSLIKIPIRLHTGEKDILVTASGIRKFTAHLSSLEKDVSTTYYQDWDHFSVFMAKDSRQFIGNVLKDIQEMFEAKKTSDKKTGGLKEKASKNLRPPKIPVSQPLQGKPKSKPSFFVFLNSLWKELTFQ